jgi:hypothetical protein
LVCGRVSRESRHKIQCRGSFCVGTDTHFGRKLLTFRHVADMSPTCRRHSQLSSFTAVCNMDTMRLKDMEDKIFSKYVNIVCDIPDKQCVDNLAHLAMLSKY